MATCKDCIHFGICKKGFPWADGVGGGWCEDFKDKSRLVELPYKVGSEVEVIRSQTSNGKNLYITNERISHYRVFVGEVRMCFDSCRLSIPDYQWCDVFSGENAREAAKAALKRRK